MTIDRAIRVLDVYASVNGSGQCTQDEFEEAKKMAIEALKGKDTNVPSRKGVFIPDITVEMFRNAPLKGVEELMVNGEMEDISLPPAQPEERTETHACDLISRQAALECLEWRYPDALPATKIKELPSVKPERPKGEWITDDLSGIISCSRCGNNAPMETTGGGQYKSKFCPDCGADMRGEQIKELLETDVATVFEVLKAAHDKIEEWSKRSEQDE